MIIYLFKKKFDYNKKILSNFIVELLNFININNYNIKLIVHK